MSEFPVHLANEWIDTLLSRRASDICYRCFDGVRYPWRLLVLVVLDIIVIHVSHLIAIVVLLVRPFDIWSIVMGLYVAMQITRKNVFHLDKARHVDALVEYKGLSASLFSALQHELLAEHDTPFEHILNNKARVDSKFEAWSNVRSKADWRFKILCEQDYTSVKEQFKSAMSGINCEYPDSLFEHFPK